MDLNHPKISRGLSILSLAAGVVMLSGCVLIEHDRGRHHSGHYGSQHYGNDRGRHHQTYSPPRHHQPSYQPPVYCPPEPPQRRDGRQNGRRYSSADYPSGPTYVQVDQSRNRSQTRTTAGNRNSGNASRPSADRTPDRSAASPPRPQNNNRNNNQAHSRTNPNTESRTNSRVRNQSNAGSGNNNNRPASGSGYEPMGPSPDAPRRGFS